MNTNQVMAKASTHFRSYHDPRRYYPRVWWDGSSWNMSVRDFENTHHVKCSHSWTEIGGYAKTWALVNRSHGLIDFPDAPATHVLAA
jgi:hypothetical protein